MLQETIAKFTLVFLNLNVLDHPVNWPYLKPHQPCLCFWSTLDYSIVINIWYSDRESGDMFTLKLDILQRNSFCASKTLTVLPVRLRE